LDWDFICIRSNEFAPVERVSALFGAAVSTIAAVPLFQPTGDEPMTYQETHNRESSDEQKIRRKVRELNEHVTSGKPCYWDHGQKRHRVFRARMNKGKFQIMPIAPQKWLDASLTDNFEFCR
jgi:hypothetical protein